MPTKLEQKKKKIAERKERKKQLEASAEGAEFRTYGGGTIRWKKNVPKGAPTVKEMTKDLTGIWNLEDIEGMGRRYVYAVWSVNTEEGKGYVEGREGKAYKVEKEEKVKYKEAGPQKGVRTRRPVEGMRLELTALYPDTFAIMELGRTAPTVLESLYELETQGKRIHDFNPRQLEEAREAGWDLENIWEQNQERMEWEREEAEEKWREERKELGAMYNRAFGVKKTIITSDEYKKAEEEIVDKYNVDTLEQAEEEMAEEQKKKEEVVAARVKEAGLYPSPRYGHDRLGRTRLVGPTPREIATLDDKLRVEGKEATGRWFREQKREEEWEQALKDRKEDRKNFLRHGPDSTLFVPTLEGEMRADETDIEAWDRLAKEKLERIKKEQQEERRQERRQEQAREEEEKEREEAAEWREEDEQLVRDIREEAGDLDERQLALVERAIKSYIEKGRDPRNKVAVKNVMIGANNLWKKEGKEPDWIPARYAGWDAEPAQKRYVDWLWGNGGGDYTWDNGDIQEVRKRFKRVDERFEEVILEAQRDTVRKLLMEAEAEEPEPEPEPEPEVPSAQKTLEIANAPKQESPKKKRGSEAKAEFAAEYAAQQAAAQRAPSPDYSLQSLYPGLAN